jgi:hypothetical protein
LGSGKIRVAVVIVVIEYGDEHQCLGASASMRTLYRKSMSFEERQKLPDQEEISCERYDLTILLALSRLSRHSLCFSCLG